MFRRTWWWRRRHLLINPFCPHRSLQTDNFGHVPKEKQSRCKDLRPFLDRSPSSPSPLSVGGGVGHIPRVISALFGARLAPSGCSFLIPSTHKNSQKGPMVLCVCRGVGGAEMRPQRKSLNGARSEHWCRRPLHPSTALGSTTQTSRFPTHLGPSGAHIVRYQFLTKPWSKGLCSGWYLHWKGMRRRQRQNWPVPRGSNLPLRHSAQFQLPPDCKGGEGAPQF